MNPSYQPTLKTHYGAGMHAIVINQKTDSQLNQSEIIMILITFNFKCQSMQSDYKVINIS